MDTIRIKEIVCWYNDRDGYSVAILRDRCRFYSANHKRCSIISKIVASLGLQLRPFLGGGIGWEATAND